MFIRGTVAVVLIAVSAAAAVAQEHVGHGPGMEHGHEHEDARVIEGLGEWSQTITTSAPEAQRFFNQGLRLAYGFNHEEAARSFEEAIRLDPSCAMCAWGLAYALSPNINLPMSPEAEARALASIRRAQSLAPGVTPREREYIQALAKRFGEPAGEQRAQRDSAYANEMRVVAARYPDDADAQVLYADAMMNLRPWDQWTRAGEPKPGTREVVAVLERVVEREPEHAGACHFYVHAVEASSTPERALPCAERLPKLMPGAGHVVHMPAHVYLRVGMYEKAARANVAAVEADQRYFVKNDVQPGIYPLFYHPHNLHFLWAAYMMSGQREKSAGAARALSERVSLDMAREEASLQAFLTASVLTHVRFGDWTDVLSTPRPGDGLPYANGMWHHARGIAHAALGDVAAASAELDSLRSIAADVPDDMIIIINPATSVLRIAELVLEARIAAAGGETQKAVTLLRQAAALEDGLTYDEPPPLYQSVRQVLGDVLLAAERYGEAESAYREDLKWVRESGWSLAGLELALRARGRTAEADAVAKRLKQAWQHADVSPRVAQPRPRFRGATLPTGARLHWAESGSAAGRTVILLHGYSDSWFSWSTVMPRLSDDVRAIAVDMRGHGRSADAPPSFRIDELADDIVALMDHLGILRATVVGHSLGTLVAQAVAAEHPSRVDGLVLIGAIPTGSLPLMGELREIIADQPDPIGTDFIREFQYSTLATPLPQPFMDRIIAESGRLSGTVWRGVASGWAGADYRDRLAETRPPTLLIWGDRDAMFGLEDQRMLLNAIPGSRMVTYEGVGHAVHWEAPERAAGDIMRFVRTVANDPSASGR